MFRGTIIDTWDRRFHQYSSEFINNLINIVSGCAMRISFRILQIGIYKYLWRIFLTRGKVYSSSSQSVYMVLNGLLIEPRESLHLNASHKNIARL